MNFSSDQQQDPRHPGTLQLTLRPLLLLSFLLTLLTTALSAQTESAAPAASGAATDNNATLITAAPLVNPDSSSSSPADSARKGPEKNSGSTATGSGLLGDMSNAPIPDAEAFRLTLSKLLWSLILFSVAYIFIRYLSKLLEALAERWANIRVTVKGIIPIIRISSWTIVLYVIIVQVFAPPIETLLAVTASAGIAIGFASQDILKNIFGGIMILLDRPFQVGDKIEVGKYYGEVVHIGLRTVRIVTPGDSLVSIPNTEIVNQSVSNANSGENNCQVIADFYVPLTDRTAEIRSICEEAAKTSRYCYLNKPITVIIRNEIHQGRSLYHVSLKAYVLDIRYEFLFISDMTETVTRDLITADILRQNPPPSNTL